MERTELPAGWRWATIGEVCSPPQYGWTTSASSTGKLRLLRTTDISSGQIDWDRVPFCESDPPDPGKYLLNPGDIVISRAGSVGYSYLIKSAEQAVFASYLIRFHPTAINGNYLAYFLQSPAYWEAISEAKLGIAVQNVNATKLRQIPVPLPPLAEQRQIVNYIETQFTRLDAAVAALKRVQANLRRYRASVLKAACEGSLVPTEAALAQAEGRSYEPASALLQRVLAERRARWQADHPGKTYKEPAGPDTDTLPELPEGWCWAAIGQLFSVQVGSTPSRQNARFWNGDIPWVSSGEVAFKRILDTEEKISHEGLVSSSAKVNPPGTVLLAMIGEGKTRGQAAILDISAANNQNVAAIRVSQTPVAPEWVYYWLMASYEMTRRAGSGGMQYALNSERVRSIAIPLPPINEMLRIVSDLDATLSSVDSLEDNIIRVCMFRAARLRQSVLQQAFRGQLLNQAPADRHPTQTLPLELS